MTLYDLLCSWWRTAVPVIVGWLGTLLAGIYVDIDEQALTSGLTAAFAVVYYGLFRLLETKASPAFGWFLGLARPPAYPATPASPDKHTDPIYGSPPV